MTAIIIEDEALAARELESILKKLAQEIEIVARQDSVRGSVQWLKENQVDLVQIKGDVAKIRGNNYIVYGSPFKKSSYKFAMLERGNAREILFQRIITSITVIWLIGLGILFIVWRFTKEIFIEPVENIIMKKELQKNKAQLQFLQILPTANLIKKFLTIE